MGWFERDNRMNHASDGSSEVDSYAPGDLISQQYLVLALLGYGGFGTVYLVESADTGGLYALKVIRSLETDFRAIFRREALFWVGLDRHPHVLNATLVDEVNGQLFILSEYIAQDSRGVNTLANYAGHPQSFEKTLNLFVQVCDGMTWTYSQGLIAHRDLKPQNIMISEGSPAKVNDFGIAITRDSDSTFWEKFGPVGTPPYMAPEQLEAPSVCDERSDIYAFGGVMSAVSSGPDLAGHEDLHSNNSHSPLLPLIGKCLKRNPQERYQSFGEVRQALMELAGNSGLRISKPVPVAEELAFWEWDNKGASYLNLGRAGRALECFSKALEQAPNHAPALRGKGNAFLAIGDYEGALSCYSKALEAEPDSIWTLAARATALRETGRLDQAGETLSHALELAPDDAILWTNKGNLEASSGHAQAALECYDHAVSLDESFAHVWFCKGTYLDDIGRRSEALTCLDRAVELNPLDSNTWDNRGVVQMNLGKKREALASFERAIVCNPENALAVGNKAMCLTSLFPFKRLYFEEAATYAVTAIKMNAENPAAWFAYGRAHDGLGHNDEAITGYVNFLDRSRPDMAEQAAWVRRRLGTIS